jgi:hypothetical protein
MALTKRSAIDLLEKAVMDGKLPDSLLYQVEGGERVKLDEKQAGILLSYTEDFKPTFRPSRPPLPARTIEKISEDLKDIYKMRRDAQFHRPAYQVFDNRVRYTREEWQKLEKAEQAKEDAKYSFPKARRVIRCEG